MESKRVFVLRCASNLNLSGSTAMHLSAHSTLRGACERAAEVMMPTDWKKVRALVGRALECKGPSESGIPGAVSFHDGRIDVGIAGLLSIKELTVDG